MKIYLELLTIKPDATQYKKVDAQFQARPGEHIYVPFEVPDELVEGEDDLGMYITPEGIAHIGMEMGLATRVAQVKAHDKHERTLEKTAKEVQ